MCKMDSELLIKNENAIIEHRGATHKVFTKRLIFVWRLFNADSNRVQGSIPISNINTYYVFQASDCE